MLELNQKTFHDREEWYYRYAAGLISEVANFRNVLELIIDRPTMKQFYQKSKEILTLYACILGVVRFLEVNLIINNFRASHGVTPYS